MLHRTRICDTLNKLGESIALSTCTIHLNLSIIAFGLSHKFAQLQISCEISQSVKISGSDAYLLNSEKSTNEESVSTFVIGLVRKSHPFRFFDLLEAPMVESCRSLFLSRRGNGLVSLYLEHRRRAKRMLIFVEQSRCISCV